MSGAMSAMELPLPRWAIPELDRGAAPVEAAPDTEMSATEAPLNLPVTDAELESAEIEAKPDPFATGYSQGWECGRAEGEQQGYAEGMAAATATAKAALALQSQRLTAIIQKMGAPITALDAAVEEAVVALALEVARAVIGAETSQSRDYLVRLIREAVAKVPVDIGAVRIVLNPADEELVRELAPDLETSGAAVVADTTVEPGDCLVVAGGATPVRDLRWRPRAGDGGSQVDLSLAARWRAVMRDLFEGENR